MKCECLFQDFHGLVVRVDLMAMDNMTSCMQNVRVEWYNATLNQAQSIGVPVAQACVVVLDLTTIHPLAKGFRRGFAGYPYAYLSAGEYNVVVRLHISSKHHDAMDKFFSLIMFFV